MTKSSGGARAEAAAAFRALRIAMGLWGSEVAAALGVRSETISRWEHGRAPIPYLAQVAFRGMANDPELVMRMKSGRKPTQRRRHAES